MNIIFEDKEIMVVNKPAGQLSQSGKDLSLDLVSEVLNTRRERGEQCEAFIINRLDRPVSGLVLIAKTKQAAARYSKLLQSEGGFNKQYMALVCGKPDASEGELVNYLVHDKKNNLSYVTDDLPDKNEAKKVVKNDSKNEAKLARLRYELVSYDEEKDVSLVRIHLLTGRHHQIRVQFSNIGCPIVGDGKYSNGIDVNRDARFDGRKIALCAAALSCGGREFKVDAPF